MITVLEFLAFVWASITSPHGACVAALFCLLIWAFVGVQRLRDRAEHRAHTAEMRRLLEGGPAPERARKILIPDYRKDPGHAA